MNLIYLFSFKFEEDAFHLLYNEYGKYTFGLEFKSPDSHVYRNLLNDEKPYEQILESKSKRENQDPVKEPDNFKKEKQ